ncbi:BTB/POZ domain-containing protein 6-B [Nilaparvata lugens]|uniref:BTB/POZ domain-containing protein 6-B n=1 Tax=Nilaparvata lugens TaxID=108931 RepID=UPI00193D30D3|nr:BTB/POZ domain-containing protein 6-B [Nilaparvata lugens]
MSSTPASLTSKFEVCLNNDDLSDCEFIVGKHKRRIKGHKLLFGISSPVFRAMLYDDPKNTVTFQIEDVEADEFNGMKQFFYTESVHFTSSLHACSLYLASWKYVIPDLMTACVQYIKDNISVSEAIEVYEFSRLNNIPDIEPICCALFQNKTKEIMESEKFLSADIQTLESILKMDSLKLKSELEVFEYTEKWALAEARRSNIDKHQLGEHFNSITKQIRFLTMSKDQYLEGPYKSDLLTAEKKLLIAHNLLGFEDEMLHKLISETKVRVFTEEEEGENVENKEGEEEEEEGENVENKEGEEEEEEGENVEDKEVEGEEEGVIVINKEVEEENDKTDRIVHKILKNVTNVEKFHFIFNKREMSHVFRYQEMDFEIYLSILKCLELDNQQMVWLTLICKYISKYNIKLCSVEKVKIVWGEGQKFNNTFFKNVSIIDSNEIIFPYITTGKPPTSGVDEIHFDLTLSKL